MSLAYQTYSKYKQVAEFFIPVKTSSRGVSESPNPSVESSAGGGDLVGPVGCWEGGEAMTWTRMTGFWTSAKRQAEYF